MAWPRSALLTLLSLTACPAEPDGSSSTDTGSSTATTAATSEATATATTTDAVTTGPPDACPHRPDGDWNACQTKTGTDNSLCGFVDNGGNGSITCLSPQSGNFNVCGIRDCVDDCDCFAPPKTGDAPATCAVVFGGGGKGCVLYCLNGQKCPDGMECASGTCYWPN